MPAAAYRPHVNPAAYLRIAFDALNWTGCTFEAAMQQPTRRQIIEFIANYYPQKMETIVLIGRIEQLANKAALHHPRASDAQPYPAHTSAAKLFVLFFDVEQKRLLALAQQALPAMKEVA